MAKTTKTINKLEVPVYSFETGKSVDTVQLPVNIFGVEPSTALIHQVIVALDAQNRQTLAHAKTKAEVRGGGKKPWKQKGTGHARQGSTRNPQWIGGGVAHGPSRDRNFYLKINKKMQLQATRMAFSDRAMNESLLVIRDLVVSEAKTKKAILKLKQLPIGKTTLIITAENDTAVIRSLRNVPNVKIVRAQDAGIKDVLKHKTLIVSELAIPVLVNRLAK